MNKDKLIDTVLYNIENNSVRSLKASWGKLEVNRIKR